jgi:hypothetical protein
MNITKAEQPHVPPSPGTKRKSKTNGGKMDLYTLLIARSLSEPKVRASINRESSSYQAEGSLPAIDFSLLADVRREQHEEARREGRFVPATAIRATA